MLSFYPNPANNSVSIEFGYTNNKKADLFIRNISGKTVISKLSLNTERIDIDIYKFKKGTYILTVDRKGESYSKKFIKN